MLVKVSVIDDTFCSFGSFPQTFTSEMKPDKTGFVQNRIFLLIINEICVSTTITHFHSFSQQQLYVYIDLCILLFTFIVWEDVHSCPILSIATSL